MIDPSEYVLYLLFTLFVLYKSNNDESNIVRAQVMAMLDFFDDHYQVSNKAVCPQMACAERDITVMKNIRDHELHTIRYHNHLPEIGK